MDNPPTVYYLAHSTKKGPPNMNLYKADNYALMKMAVTSEVKATSSIITIVITVMRIILIPVINETCTLIEYLIL